MKITPVTIYRLENGKEFPTLERAEQEARYENFAELAKTMKQKMLGNNRVDHHPSGISPLLNHGYTYETPIGRIIEQDCYKEGQSFTLYDLWKSFENIRTHFLKINSE